MSGLVTTFDTFDIDIQSDGNNMDCGKPEFLMYINIFEGSSICNWKRKLSAS